MILLIVISLGLLIGIVQGALGTHKPQPRRRCCK